MIKLLLRDWIEFVIVTLRASGGEPHPHRHRRVGTIHRISKNKLLIDRAPLTRGDVAAIESRSDLLIHGRVWQQVTRQLPDCEVVIRQVVIERLHHPIAIRPHAAFVVEMQPVRIRVARRIQPVATRVLPIAH